MPATKLQLDSFSLGRGTQEITGSFRLTGGSGAIYDFFEGAFYKKTSSTGFGHGTDGGGANPVTGFQASRTWTGMSTSAAPYTTNMGDSTPFSNMPPYLVCNIWKRLT